MLSGSLGAGEVRRSGLAADGKTSGLPLDAAGLSGGHERGIGPGQSGLSDKIKREKKRAAVFDHSLQC